MIFISEKRYNGTNDKVPYEGEFMTKPNKNTKKAIVFATVAAVAIAGIADLKYKGLLYRLLTNKSARH